MITELDHSRNKYTRNRQRILIIFIVLLVVIITSQMQSLQQVGFVNGEVDFDGKHLLNGKKQSNPPKKKQVRPPCLYIRCIHTARSGSKFCIRVSC